MRIVFCLFKVSSLFILLQKCNSNAVRGGGQTLINATSLSSHIKHFSPLRNLLCLFKSTTWKYYLKQWSHVKHFPTVRILLFLFKSQTWKKYLKQWLHVKRFSKVWILLCRFKSTTYRIYLKQWSQVKHFSLERILFVSSNKKLEKQLETISTCETFLSSKHYFLSLQITNLKKLFETMITSKIFLSSTGSFMSL